MKDSKANQIKQLWRNYPCISMEALEELTRRNLLHFDGDRWRFGDDKNGTTRKLDGRKFRVKSEYVKAFADNRGAAWHRLIGLDDVVQHDRPYALLAIEGSTDALAAAQFAFGIKHLSDTGIMCALGSGYRPIPSELHSLVGRWVVLIGDNDNAGREATQIVSYAFNNAGLGHAVWDWDLCELKTKDLYGFMMKVRYGEVKNPLRVLYPGTVFSPFPPSYNSPVHPFTPSTTQTDEDKNAIVKPFIVTKRGTSDEMSFRLARAIKPKNMNMNDIEEIFRLWFAESRPLLSKNVNEDQMLAHFYHQLTRARFTDVALEAACERARRAKPPFIPARDGDVEVAKVAALCRELQRDDPKRPFICPVGVVQEFLHLRSPSSAHYLLHVLEKEGVIECIDRGAPNKAGKKGKATMWVYKLPLDQ
jgi:hypothetical protein